jgi:hypothetical protein
VRWIATYRHIANFARLETPVRAAALGVEKFAGYSEGAPPISTGIGDDSDRQAKEEKAEQIDGRARRMQTAMQVAQTVELLQCESQAGQQPYDEQAAFVVMADMLESIAVLGIVEAFVFDLIAVIRYVCHRDMDTPLEHHAQGQVIAACAVVC